MRTPTLLAALLVGACTSSESEAPAASGYFLAADPDTGGLALLRDGAPLVRLPPEAFVLGLVDGLDDTLNYDPFYLDAFEVTWAAGRTLEPAGEGRWALEAAGGVRATVELAEVGEAGGGRFSGRFVPEQATGGVGGDVGLFVVDDDVVPWGACEPRVSERETDNTPANHHQIRHDVTLRRLSRGTIRT